MKTLLLSLIIAIASAGCATNQVYNPVTASSQQVYLLNETSLAQIKVGMAQSRVHQIMGDSIVIGYAFQKPVSSESAVSKAGEGDYKPLTIANPYKTEDIKTKDGDYIIEYYVNSIRQSDGVVSDDELIPLIFQAGILTARGNDHLKAIRLKSPASS